MFAALVQEHRKRLASAALKIPIAAIRTQRLVMRAKAARIPNMIYHEGVPRPDFKSHETKKI